LPSIFFQNREIFYSIRISHRAKRLSLRVGSKGVEVVLPRRSFLPYVPNFVEENAKWIFKHLQKWEEKKAKENEPLLPDGSILFRGIQTKVKLMHGVLAKPFVVWDSRNSVLNIVLPLEVFEAPYDVLHNWLVKFAEKEILACVKKRASQMGFYPAAITLRDQKTRWGSCSANRNIAFNWRLVMAPLEVLDYVVVHELAHLAVLSHSKRFWRLVKRFCPEHRLHRRWLRQNEALLWKPYQALQCWLSQKCQH
jgi:predicted metal-dependent hydrolase